MKKTILCIATFVVCSVSAVHAQTIADVARQERAKRQAASTTAITNKTLKVDAPKFQETIIDETKSSPATPEPAAATPAPEAAAKESPARDEKGWRDEFEKARTDLKRAESEVSVQEVELNKANTDFLTRAYDPDGRGKAAITAIEAKLGAAKANVVKANDKIAQLEEELRRSGAPGRLGPVNFLGIDGGGSKTTFLLEDEAGLEIAHLETGSSNWLSASTETVLQSLSKGISSLPSAPDVVCAGFAGAGRQEGLDFYREILVRLLPRSRILVETDAFITYAGAMGLSPGVLLIAGTGSIAVARTVAGKMVRAGGWGPVFGDEGSGYWVGREAIRSALRAHDSDTSPDYVALIARTLGIPVIADVPGAWKTGQIDVRSVAALASVVARLYPAEPARRILTRAAAHLRSIAEVARRRAGLPATCSRSIAGSLGTQEVMQQLIGLDFKIPANPPARGAILWARDRIRGS